MRYLIAGYGKFGRLALSRLEQTFPDSFIDVVESDASKIPKGCSSKVFFHNVDVISYLAGSYALNEEDVIIPMVPFHLVAAYILAKKPHSRLISVPSDLALEVPNPFPLDYANLFCSRADFICPDDCPEGDLCTVTGEPREPLYHLLEQTRSSGFTILVQRSFQILPGVGGYPFGDLRSLCRRIGHGKYLVITSCKCHAVITAIGAAD